MVRRGLHHHLVGKTIAFASVHHDRAVRRQPGGAVELAGLLAGQQISGTGRRGKYLWLTLGEGQALVVHLGMSGQMLIGPISRPQHLRIAATLDDGSVLSFVDQRTFGGWMVTDVVTIDGSDLPEPVAHIARDPLDERFDASAVVTRLRGKHTEIKRALLDQTVVSGLGTMWAAELAHTARVSPTHAADDVPDLAPALTRTRHRMRRAILDDSRASRARLSVFERTGRSCPRCNGIIVSGRVGTPPRDRVTYWCPQCQD